MNPVAIVLLWAALLTIALARPLIKGRVKMNPWYGVRIPTAFTSDENWYELNRYGGRLLFRWGISIAVTAAAGALLQPKHWVAYNWASLAIILGRGPAKNFQPCAETK